MNPSMTADEFRSFLRTLQEDQYNWPNKYFAWEKPDGTLFMVGTSSGQFNHLLTYEYKGEPYNDYSGVIYGISPRTTYVYGSQEYDPVEMLVEKVGQFKYLGSWDDPELFEQHPFRGNVYTQGRWELAKEHILGQSQESTVDEQTHEGERADAVNKLLTNLCKNTDFDLLYAQKMTLLNALETGDPVPNEALEGLINLLDLMGDLGETLGRFQYDGIEPPFPLLPEYQKKEYSFQSKPKDKPGIDLIISKAESRSEQQSDKIKHTTPQR